MGKAKAIVLLALFGWIPLGIFGQASIEARRIARPLHIDGRLDEAVWQQADSTLFFTQTYPADSIYATSPTQVRVLYDNDYLYIGASCQFTERRDYVVQSLKRDFDWEDNDGFAFIVDAHSDGASGLSFAVNPFGVQRDAIIPDGGTKGDDLSWDAFWFVEVHWLSDSWTIEMAIPFKSLRFNHQRREWRVNFVRNDLRQNEQSSWTPMPRGFGPSTLSYTRKLLWETAPPAQGKHLAIVPYTALRYRNNFLKLDPANVRPSAGLDVKMAINSALHLDLTLNPDFSQAEVDQQQINLDRFELFFPERRLFFLENSDLFAGLGNSRVRPFFSRRIGSVGNNPVPILFGARLSGKLNPNWRMGLMSIQTASAEEDDGQLAQNYMVAALQRKVLGNSSISVFMSNRQAFVDYYPFGADYNRVGGLEFDYRSADSKWTGKAFWHHSFSPGIEDRRMAYTAKLRYRNRVFSVFGGMDAVAENYLTDQGYVPRLQHTYPDTSFRIPYIQWRTNGYYRVFLPNSHWIDYLSPSLRLDVFTGHERLRFQEYEFKMDFTVRFNNSASLRFRQSDYSIRLYRPFLLRGLDKAFPAGDYRGQQMSISYDTGKRKTLSANVAVSIGDEYMGRLLKLEGELEYRRQPWGVFGALLSYRQLTDFPEAYGEADFSLLGMKLEFSLNRNLSLTNYLQYNTQSQNFNLNSRFNWRIKPMSDLYLIYTDNYWTDTWQVKDRALVLKLRYWIGL
ncbi:MAG: DUF5916 domain-containing protein [Bacteroidota bacterium]